ncbi:MAG: DNA repair protein RecO [Gammaproteobacteria bacterium]
MEIGFVLHRRRYRETSLIVDLMTPTLGRIAAVARGALRRKSALAGLLQPLVPLALELRGRSELFTLTRAEALGTAFLVSGSRLYSVFYVNELLMRLTAVHDPVPGLFEHYQATLAALAGEEPQEPVLRRFETGLLGAVGLALNLATEADSGRPLEPAREYVYVLDRGPLPVHSADNGCRVHGVTLRALAGEGELAPGNLEEAKRLMRYVINHHLDGRPLRSREFFAAGSRRKS